MTTQQIIDELLPLVRKTRRFWFEVMKYECVQAAIESYSDDAKISLAELAFELRDKAMAEKATLYDEYMWDVGNAVECRGLTWGEADEWAYKEAYPEHWVIAAIAALEGDKE